MQDENHFSVETRMPIPERSYAQELLDIPVPYENRVLFLSEYSRHLSKPTTLNSMANLLDITSHQAETLINIVDAPLTGRIIDCQLEYEENTLAVVEEELRWMQEYEALDAYITAKKAAAHLGKKPTWVMNRTNELGIYPQQRVMPSGRTGMGFEKSVILPLRHWMLHHPPAGDWASQKNIMDALGKHQDWVKPRLSDLGFETRNRIPMGHNLPSPHYPPEALDVLRGYIENQPEPAGDWLTVGTMMVLLNRSRRWILKRIGQFNHTARPRLDDFGREAVHYPPEVFFALDKLSKESPRRQVQQ